MAAQLAGFARQRYARQRLMKRLVVVSGVVIVLVVVLVGANYVRQKGTQKPIVAAQPLSFESKQAVDVHLMGAAVSQYATGTGMVPTQLAPVNGGIVLCGVACDPSQYEVTGFSVYQPVNIKLTRYTSGLTAPSAAVMYLVPGATCGSGGALGAANTNPRSMVILYQGQKTDGTTEARCIVL